MSLTTLILKDIAYSGIAATITAAVGVDDIIEKFVPARSDQILGRALVGGGVNYVTSELLDYTLGVKTPDIVQMNGWSFVDNYGYFTLASLGIGALKIDQNVVQLYDRYSPLPSTFRDPIIDGVILSGARVGRTLLDAYGYKKLAHPILLLPNELMTLGGPSNQMQSSPSSGSGVKF